MVNEKSVNLSQCTCISQDDKEILMNIVDDAVEIRRELYESINRKPIERSIDQKLLKSYENFIELVQHFKTC